MKFSIYLNTRVFVMTGLDIPGRVSSTSTKGENFCDLTSCKPSNTPRPFWKWVYSKRKECVPKIGKVLPLRVNPFSKGTQNNFDRVASPDCISIPLNYLLPSPLFSNSSFFPRGEPFTKNERGEVLPQCSSIGFHGDGLKIMVPMGRI